MHWLELLGLAYLVFGAGAGTGIVWARRKRFRGARTWNAGLGVALALVVATFFWPLLFTGNIE